MYIKRVCLLSIAALTVLCVVFAQQTKPVRQPATTARSTVQSTTQSPARSTANGVQSSPTTTTQQTKPSDNQTKTDRKVVDFEADIMRPVKIGDSSVLNLVGNVVFYHNGAVITCDSALRYSDKRMECFNNVVVNKGKTYIYGDRADYNGDINVAKIYAPIIKMVDDDVTMYTYNFSFNTKESVGKFGGGATISQKENLLESDRGYYYSNSREVVCVERVEIKNPDYNIKTDSLSYNMNTELARFFVPTYIWNANGEILSADRGSYDKINSLYHFTKNSYVLSKGQEMWADSIDFNSINEDAVMYRNIQLRDQEHKVIAFGDYGLYWGEREEAMLTKRPSIVSFDVEQDSLFMRADSMFLYTISRSQATAEAKSKIDSSQDEELIVTQTPEMNPEAQGAGGEGTPADSTKTDLGSTVEGGSTEANGQSSDDGKQKQLTKKERRKAEAERKKQEKAAKKRAKREAKIKRDGVSEQDAVKAAQAADSLVAIGGLAVDSLALAADSLAADSLAAVAKGVVSDSTSLDPADSMVRVVRGYYNVKIFREDFQAVCDSLVGFSIDSTMHLYINPVMWNEKNQIKSEVIDLYSKNQQLDKAVFTGSPIMSSQVDSVRFNQVKGKVIESFFRDNEIYRNDVNGNGETLYYMTDDDGQGGVILQGFLVAECADITFHIADRQVEQIVYRGDPVYTIYPMEKIPMDQPQLLSGFLWEIDRKPTLKDVFDREIRESQREIYETMPKPSFPLTEEIIKNRERMIKDGIWRERNDKISVEVENFIQGLGY